MQGVPLAPNIIVYASEVPLGQVKMESIGQNGLNRYMGSQEMLAVKTRGISVISAGKGNNPSVQFYEGTWTLTTER